MDNVTHTLIGVALGRSASNHDEGRNRAALWTAIIGSNLPDLDSFFTPLWGGGKLNYLLHHRGLSHTLVWVPPLALASALIGARIGKTKRKDFLFLWGIGIAALLLHVFADFWNEYGIHPFYPFVKRWFYGDSVFILEPSIWLALLPLAILSARNQFARGLFAFLELAILSTIWIFAAVPVGVRIALSVWAVIAFSIQRRIGRFEKTIPAWVMLAAIVLTFTICSQIARKAVSDLIGSHAPNEKPLQLVLAAYPGNPLCWRVISANKNPRDEYVVRMGAFSLSSTLIAPQNCLFRSFPEPSGPFQPCDLPSSDRIYWKSEFLRPLSEFRALETRSCLFRDQLRYLRIPFWISYAGKTLTGDLRYFREPRNGFTEIIADSVEACPKHVPDWEPPFQPDAP